MLDFGKTAKRRKVQAALTGRMNQQCLEGLWGDEPNRSRSLYVKAVSITPGTPKKWHFESAFPAVTVNVSPSGIALVHFAEMPEKTLVGLDDERGQTFIHCRTVHSQAIGHGYFLVGLRGMDVVTLETESRAKLTMRLAEFADSESLTQQALRSMFSPMALT